jgi:uncharacterized membrane protein YgcG
MQELLFGPLFLTWGPPVLGYVGHHPWRVFIAVLLFVSLMNFMLGKRSSSRSGDGGGDLGLFDSGGGDGGGDGGGCD